MTTAQVGEGRRTGRAKLLLACGVVGPPLFVVALLIEGWTRAGYSTWRNFGSQLSTGPWGWTQIANFIVCGLLVFLSAFGFRQVLRAQGGVGAKWGPILVGVFGLTLVIAGVFVTDPALGYPPGAAERTGGPQTWHGAIHGVNAIPCFGALTVASFLFARRYAAQAGARDWARWSLANGILQVTLFIAANVTASLDQNGTLQHAPTGLLQRIGIVTGWLWLSLVAYRELRALPQPAGSPAGSSPASPLCNQPPHRPSRALPQRGMDAFRQLRPAQREGAGPTAAAARRALRSRCRSLVKASSASRRHCPQLSSVGPRRSGRDSSSSQACSGSPVGPVSRPPATEESLRKSMDICSASWLRGSVEPGVACDTSAGRASNRRSNPLRLPSTI
jgi:hypothetical protein